ncbi:reverse transcriptase domain-containing protein [Tanacetum coccineum]
MVTPVEKRKSYKFCDFHNDKGHSTDECKQLKKHIEELVRAGNLSHLIKEIKQGREQPKVRKKEVSAKDKSMAIYMVQPWHRMTRQKVTQSFAHVSEITFPPLAASRGQKHCFNLLRPEIKRQMVTATTSLTSFSGETIWPLGQLRLLVTIGDAEHSTKAWMDFMIVRSLSPYNGIIGRPGIREIQAVPSAAHGMLKFPIDGGIAEVRHENFKVALHLNIPDQEVAIGGTLSAKGRTDLCSLLKEKLDIIAWQPSDMTGVPPEHRLNIREGYSSVQQKKRGQALERAKVIQSEVQKLVEVGIMREVYYHDWLSNPVMVKKHDDSWWIVSWTLTKAITKYKWQSRMNKRRLSKPAIEYIDIPKCPSASRTRLVDKAFANQVGRNIEVYVDDLVIKSHTETDMLRDMDETGRNVLGVLDQPIRDKTVPRQDISCAATPSTEKSLPLFKTLKKWIKKSDFDWTPEAEQAFKQLKQHLSELPMLVAPKPKEELIVYMSASHGAISAVLMTERGTVQMSVYFVSRALQGPELHYTPMENLVIALVFRRPRGRISLLKQTSPEGTEFTYALRFQFTASNNEADYEALIVGLRIAAHMECQFALSILADFLVEKPNEAPPDTSVVETPQEPWTLFTDGSSCVDGSGASLILTSPEGTEFTYALRFQFTASNNEADYEALIVGLRIAAHMGMRNVHASVDSKLVANQVLGTYVAKEENMIKYLENTKSLVSGFANFSISQVPRSKNKKADALSKIASTSFAHLSKQVLVEVLKEKCIQEREVATVVEEDGPTWMTPIMEYLKDGTLPDDRKEASKLRIKARQTMIHGGQSHAVGILLANHASGCMGYDTQIWSLPGGTRKGQVFDSCYGLFYEVDRGKSCGNSGSQVKKFVLDNIVCHFGLPGEIVSDNEAVIPVEVEMPTYRTAVVDTVHNDDKELRLNLDLLEERRERAAIREANAKLKMTKYYNARVRGVTFRLGDFVYRSNDGSHAVDGGKLGPK